MVVYFVIFKIVMIKEKVRDKRIWLKVYVYSIVVKV